MSFCQLIWIPMLILSAKLSLCQADKHELIAENFTNIAYSMCPAHGFCQRKLHNDTGVAQESCCSPCSCDKDCSISQTCCPDADVDNFGSVRLRCRHQDEHFNYHRNIYLMLSDKYPRFYVTDTCKEGYLDEDVISGCHSPKTLREHVYVTDPSSTLIYKNDKCAICNDVKERITWDLRVICPFKYDLYSADRMSTYLLEECSFASEPPSSLASLSDIWKCPYNMMSACNVTEDWDQYDPVLEEGCMRFNTPYIGETLSNLGGQLRRYRSLFQNVYCYLCNTNPAKRGSLFCGKWAPDNDGDRDMFVESFSALLDISAAESMGRIQDDKQGQCRIDEIPDPLTKTCVRMLCPVGSVAIEGECTSHMREISGCLAASFSFSFELSEPTPSSQEIAEQVFGAMHDVFVKRFDMNSCIYCTIFVLSNNIILIDAKSNPGCGTALLLEVFQFLEGSYRIKIKDVVAIVQVELTSRYPFSNEFYLRDEFVTNRVHIVSEETRRKCVMGTVLTPKFYCKRITLSFEELIMRGISNTTVSKIALYSEPALFVDGIAKRHVICLHDYTRIVNRGGKPLVMLSWSVATLQVMAILVSTQTTYNR